MIQYDMNEISDSIFEISMLPRLSYIKKITAYEDSLKIFHKHQDFAEIVFVEKGRSTCTINNKQYKIKKGDLLLINSGISHNTAEKKSPDLAFIILGIKNLQFKNMSKNQLIAQESLPIISIYKTQPELSHFFSIFNAITKINVANNQVSINSCTSYLLQALLVFLNDIQSSNIKTADKEYSLGLRIKEYIDTHYLDDITLSDIAKALNISSYYLSHSCKKYLGSAPMQYIISQRIKEAQKLLINTDLTITEIAFQCGYNNSNYFQSVFNNMVGMPPGKYRKSWQE